MKNFVSNSLCAVAGFIAGSALVYSAVLYGFDQAKYQMRVPSIDQRLVGKWESDGQPVMSIGECGDIKGAYCAHFDNSGANAYVWRYDEDTMLMVSSFAPVTATIVSTDTIIISGGESGQKLITRAK